MISQKKNSMCSEGKVVQNSILEGRALGCPTGELCMTLGKLLPSKELHSLRMKRGNVRKIVRTVTDQ